MTVCAACGVTFQPSTPEERIARTCPACRADALRFMRMLLVVFAVGLAVAALAVLVLSA